MILSISHITLLVISILLRSVIAIPLNLQPDRSKIQARQPSAYIKYPLDHMARPSPIPLALSQSVPLRGSSLAARHIEDARFAPSPPSTFPSARPVVTRRAPKVINLMMTSDKVLTDEENSGERLSKAPARRTAFYQQWRLLQRQKHPRQTLVKV